MGCAVRHLEVAARLRLVQRQGVGLDKLDVTALREHGTAVAICPDGTAEAVADHTLLLMLAAGRHLVQLHVDVTQRGRWPKWDYRDRSLGLQGAVIGIVGFGRVGRAVAQRVLVAGSDVLVHRSGGRPLDGHWPAGRVRTADFGQPTTPRRSSGCSSTSTACAAWASPPTTSRP